MTLVAQALVCVEVRTKLVALTLFIKISIERDGSIIIF